MIIESILHREWTPQSDICKKTTSSSKHRWLFVIVLVMVFYVLPGNGALAQDFALKYYGSLSPASIPVGQDLGTSTVVMTGIRFQTTGGSINITQIGLQLTNTPAGFDEALITDIRVYFELNGGEPGSYDGTETLVSTSPQIFSSGTANIGLTGVTTDASGFDNLYVVIDLDEDAGFIGSSPETGETIGVEITSIVHSGGNSPFTSFTAHGQEGEIDDYEVTVSASGLATGGPPPPGYEQGDSDIPVLELFFDALDTSFGGTPPTGAHVDAITFTLVGSGSASDISSGGVLLYEDTDDSSTFNPPTDQLVGSASAAGTTAFVDPGSNLDIDSGGGRYFVALTLASDASVGETIGLTIADPSTDIQFTDTITTDIGVGTQYQQLGYITATSLSVSDNTVTIEENIPFLVTQFTPPDSETDVARESDVTAVFAKDVDDTTLAGNFTLVDSLSSPVSASISYDAGQKKATLDPDTNLNWSETYTATVTTSVLDSEGNPLEAQQQWSFTVEDAVYPTVLITVPDDGETNVVRGIKINATFSEDVSGVDGSSFTLDQGGTPIDGIVTYNASSFTATFTPDATLAYNTEYTATITTDVYDDDLLNLQSNKVWDFWTLPATPPAVLSVFPANGTTDVPIGSTVQAVFSKPINDTTLDTHFTVEDSLGSQVSGAITYDAGSFTATFTPTEPFKYLKTYTATITTDVTDSEGTALTIGKSWDFTTFGFEKATVVNNRIVSGGNSEMLIFVPVPSSTSDKVSVQVFTTTGRLVRTFYRNATYSAIESQLPIQWDGTNDRGQNLGPGMYFVQIVVAGTKQTLKAMIVR